MAHLQNCYSNTKGLRKVGHNTRATRTPNSFSVIYHRTEVVRWECDENGSEFIAICHGGWMTKTTAERIRYALQQCAPSLTLLTSDLPYVWRIADKHGNAYTIRGNSLVLVRPASANTWSRA